ncbi:MAG: hypothetical protein AB1758_23500, partial [Candidatus Eremiobacterota bacterium]
LRYRFGLGTAQFLVCGRCGVYVAAVLEAESRTVATVNVNSLDEPMAGAATPVSYGEESAQERIDRRLRMWTPGKIRERSRDQEDTDAP